MKPKWFIAALLLNAIADGLGQPVITTQPTNQSVSLGANPKFQVSATSAHQPILYQWQFAGANLDGRTNSALALTNVQVINAGDYDVVLTDGSGTVTSRVARLDVDPTFTKITVGPIVNDGGYGFGCAWGDYDGDGSIDLFACNYANGTQHDFLYHNRGDGTFERITTVPMVNANAWATAASWGDYDNDGRLDLFVTRPGSTGSGPNTLYHNDGNGQFTKITTGLLVTEPSTSHAGIWADFNNDGLLDLFVANFRFAGSPGSAADNYLYYNQGGGTFQRVSFGAKSALNGDSFDAAAADFNNDGWLDLLIAQGAANNKQNNLLYTNNCNGQFTLLTNSIVFLTKANSAGIAWGDYDNDGFPDLFISNNPGATNLLYHNNGDGTFTLVTNSILVREQGSSAGCAWADYDNDGWLDLFVAHIGGYDQNFNVTNQEFNCLYHNNGDGTFTKVTRGSLVNEAGYSFGCAWGDYDNDGFLDLFVSNGWVQQSENNFLYRNMGNSNNWINFRLVGTVSNRTGIGVKVRVKATIGGKTFWQLREISGGSGHGCQNDLRASFGLGDATNVDLVRIEWPSGIVQTMTNVPAKQFLTIEEHQRPAEPPRFTNLSWSLGTGSDLRVSGAIGFRYLFEASTNLVDWAWLGVRTNLSGTVQFTDRHATNAPVQFYRVAAP
jgi:hypothetical protein